MRKSLLLGLLALASTVFIARANINLADPVISPTNGGFTWSYQGSVTNTESVVSTVGSQSFFTIYDFGNFTLGSNQQPAGWSFSSSLTTTPPNGLTVTDDPTKANLTWTYTGGPQINGLADLGAFSVVAATNQTKDGEYAALATSTSNGSPDVNKNNINVPVPEMSAFLPILSLCGAAAVGSIPSLLRRRKSS